MLWNWNQTFLDSQSFQGELLIGELCWICGAADLVVVGVSSVVVSPRGGPLQGGVQRVVTSQFSLQINDPGGREDVSDLGNSIPDVMLDSFSDEELSARVKQRD